jgi:hypothetical protein
MNSTGSVQRSEAGVSEHGNGISGHKQFICIIF